jgi:antitoxin CptB
MSGTQISSAGLDARRRRIVFRAWHRGMREMDLVMGRFADAEIARLSEAELDLFEALLEVPDQAAFAWVTSEADPPEDYKDLLRKIQSFHAKGRPQSSDF